MSPKAKRPGQSVLLLLDVAARLTERGIDYAVVGALAAATYGAIRATTDADAMLSISVPGLARLEKVFRAAGFRTEFRRGDADDPIPALLAVSDRHGNRVDLLAGVRGLDTEAFVRCTTVRFRGANLRFIGPEDFIAMKCFAGGPPDMADARRVLKALDRPIDVDLLRRVTRRFGRTAAENLESLLEAWS